MAAAFSYRREIDGLRALAVLPVLLFHAGFETFSGGFIGVDIFFVISGYLITSILLTDMEAEKFSLLKFYERRARRILPALCTVILVSMITAYAIMLDDQWKNFLQSSISVMFFASNIFFWSEDDYFAVASEEKPLLHTWSLAVEEQYYIIFPILLIMMWRFGRNPMLYVIGGLALLSFISAEYGSRHYQSANFYLLFGRAWEILAGSIAAFYMSKTDRTKFNRPMHLILAWVGFSMLCIAIFLFDKETPFPSAYALFPVIGTVLIIICARTDSGLGKLLSAPILVGIGLISYSLYLWHQPVFAFTRLLVFEIDWVLKIELIFLSIILAIGSYYMIEKPARFTWLKNDKPMIFIMKALILPAIIVVLAVFLLWQKTSAYHKNTTPYAGTDTPWAYSVTNAKNSGRMILYGDSHARQYARAVENHAAVSAYDFELIAGPACISLPGLTSYYRGTISAECIDQWRRLHETNSKKDVIMIAHRWGPLLSDVDGNEIGQIEQNNSSAASAAMLRGLRDLIGQYDGDQRFIIMGNVPAAAAASEQMQRGPARCAQLIDGDCPMSYDRREGELYAFNGQLRDMLRAYPNAHFIDPYDNLCDNERCYVGRNGDIYYSDDAHLTDVGVQTILIAEADTLDAILYRP